MAIQGFDIKKSVDAWHANIMIQVPAEVSKAVPPRFAKQLSALGSDGAGGGAGEVEGAGEAEGAGEGGVEGQEGAEEGQEGEGIILGIDLNRLDCLRTTCYGLLQVAAGKAEAIDLEGMDFPREEWAMLLDAAEFSSGDPQVTKEGNAFLNKIENAVIDADVFGMDQHLPARSASDAPETGDAESAPRWTFNDWIGAPIKYWSGKRAHLLEHIRSCQQAKRAFKAENVSVPGGFVLGKKKLRLEREIFLLNRRYESLRKVMKQYAARALAYVLARFLPSGVGYEALQMDPEGQERGLAQIVQGMFKAFSELSDPAVFWLQSASAGGYQSPYFVSVTPRNTSKYEADCRLAGDEFAEVDRRASSDVGWCEGLISGTDDPEAIHYHGFVDSHFSAAKNIALNYREKAAKIKRAQSRTAPAGEPPPGSGPPE
ncbi:MAG TPA: hypothetical protein VKK79_18985 [Candidatus Lokiarchaeia archaeon]|nr:hypothetical protein [Candidatus Lokiarchaeia archaeon]